MRIDFIDHAQKYLRPKSVMARAIEAQLRAYFLESRTTFDLPLHLSGTDFQRRVWQAIRAIKAGTTKTYGEIAQAMDTSARAVGNACRANPIPVLIPCHRVVARDGIGGFSGKTVGKEIQRKQWLLRHEGIDS